MRKLKLQKLIEKYDLEDLSTALEHKYLEENKSLRDLAEYVNIAVAREFFDEEPFSGEHVYRVLNDAEGISRQEQTDLRKRLREEDVPIGELERDWIGHMPVKSFLNRVLDIDTSRERTTRSPEEAITNIRRTADYHESVIREILAGVEGLDLAGWDLHTDHRLIHAETGESIRLESRLQRLDGDADQ